MKLSYIRQRSFEYCSDGYDVVVAASGYESRARFVCEQLSQMRAPISTKLVFGFAEHRDDYARRKNDRVFKGAGFRSQTCGGSDPRPIRSAIKGALSDTNRKELRILVDISSMTRGWYGAIVQQLAELQSRACLTVHFSYTAAEFAPPPDVYPPNRIVAPVSGFVGHTLPDLPTALVIGLGYDRDRAIGLMDHLDPRWTFLFYASPSSDPRYVDEVLRVNSELLEDVDFEAQFTYPINDCVKAFRLVESSVTALMHRSRVVLCSLGPKLFGLSCFLIACVYRDISIWRVSADVHETPVDRRPAGNPTILETVWTPDFAEVDP